jgi:hypothetical protein
MNRFVNLFAASLIALSLFACSKKEEVSSEPVAATETMNTASAASTVASDAQATPASAAQ